MAPTVSAPAGGRSIGSVSCWSQAALLDTGILARFGFPRTLRDEG